MYFEDVNHLVNILFLEGNNDRISDSCKCPKTTETRPETCDRSPLVAVVIMMAGKERKPGYVI